MGPSSRSRPTSEPSQPDTLTTRSPPSTASLLPPSSCRGSGGPPCASRGRRSAGRTVRSSRNWRGGPAGRPSGWCVAPCPRIHPPPLRIRIESQAAQCSAQCAAKPQSLNFRFFASSVTIRTALVSTRSRMSTVTPRQSFTLVQTQEMCRIEVTKQLSRATYVQLSPRSTASSEDSTIGLLLDLGRASAHWPNKLFRGLHLGARLGPEPQESIRLHSRTGLPWHSCAALSTKHGFVGGLDDWTLAGSRKSICPLVQQALSRAALRRSVGNRSQRKHQIALTNRSPGGDMCGSLREARFRRRTRRLDSCWI